MVRAAVAAQQKKRNRTPADKDSSRASQNPPSDVGALISRRVDAVRADDPQRERKVFRAFLEATLLAELGGSLVNDPRFATMVDSVQEQMESDPQISAAVGEAVRLLMTPPPPAV